MVMVHSHCWCKYRHHTLCVTNITTTCISHKHHIRHTPKQRNLDPVYWRLKSESQSATNETALYMEALEAPAKCTHSVPAAFWLFFFVFHFTIRVSFFLPPFFSLTSSPLFFKSFSATLLKTALVSALNRCHGDFRFHDSSLSLSPPPLLSPLLFLIVFTAKTAPFLAHCTLVQCVTNQLLFWRTTQHDNSLGGGDFEEVPDLKNGYKTGKPRYKSWINFLRQNQYRFCERVPILERP